VDRAVARCFAGKRRPPLHPSAQVPGLSGSGQKRIRHGWSGDVGSRSRSSKSRRRKQHWLVESDFAAIRLKSRNSRPIGGKGVAGHVAFRWRKKRNRRAPEVAKRYGKETSGQWLTERAQRAGKKLAVGFGSMQTLAEGTFSHDRQGGAGNAPPALRCPRRGRSRRRHHPSSICRALDRKGAVLPVFHGRAGVKKQEGPAITIVATSRFGGAFISTGKIPGANYTVYWIGDRHRGDCNSRKTIPPRIVRPEPIVGPKACAPICGRPSAPRSVRQMHGWPVRQPENLQGPRNPVPPP